MTFNFSHLAKLKPKYALLQTPLERFKGFEDDDKKTWNQITDLTIESLTRNAERFDETHFFLRPTSTIFTRRRKGSIEKTIECTFGIDRITKINVINIATPYESSVSELCERNYSSFLNNPDKLFTLKLGSTLPLAIVLGLQLGYKKICLFGCDLLDSQHFYNSEDHSNFYQGSHRYPLIWKQDSSSSIQAQLVDRSIRKTNQIDDVKELSIWLKLKLGVEVRIINNDTAFAGHLDIAADSDFY